MVKLLVQYLYEAEYEPALPLADNETTNGVKPQREPHSCSKNPNGYHCDYNVSYHPVLVQICSHYRCGNQCSYSCVNFFCETCQGSINGGADRLMAHVKMYEIADKTSLVSGTFASRSTGAPAASSGTTPSLQSLLATSTAPLLRATRESATSSPRLCPTT